MVLCVSVQELLALTGVEDKLQMDVKPTLETLRNAGIRVWMLTGDKVMQLTLTIRVLSCTSCFILDYFICLIFCSMAALPVSG